MKSESWLLACGDLSRCHKRSCAHTLHLDTYSISVGKVLWNFTGERRGPGPPPVGRHRSNREPCFHRGVGYVRLEEVGLIQPSPRRSRVAACAPAFEAAFVQSGRPLAL